MNYDSLNEIFASGVTNMSCLLQDSSSYDEGTIAVTGAEFIRFLGEAVTSIYAHGNSYWGIGSDISSLKVNNRDTRMRSLYREEGTLFSYYRFIKIRWEGWSHHNYSSTDYQLKYDLIFWDTGDISLHMVEVPLLCYDGVFEFSADKNYTYTKPTEEAPDVTFQYYEESGTFGVKYTPIDLLVPFKILVQDSDGVLYTLGKSVVNEGTEETAEVLVPFEESELSAYLFKTKGFDKLPEWDLIKDLDTPTILSWSDSRAFPITALITGTPPPQYVECTADLSDGTVLGIKALNAEYSGDVTVQYSFDGETFTEQMPMADFLTSDLDEMFARLTEDKRITFRFWLSGDASLTTFVMTYRNGDDDDAE